MTWTSTADPAGFVAHVGRFLECVLARREEPAELDRLGAVLAGRRPRSQSVRVLAGTRGVMLGSCLATFPEFVAAREVPAVQTWGLFYASKFGPAAGVLMFEWLHTHGAGVSARNDRVRLDLSGCLEGLSVLAAEIGVVERASSDDEYVTAAERFVRNWLPQPSHPNSRYDDPRRYATLVRPRLPHLGLVNFARPVC